MTAGTTYVMNMWMAHGFGDTNMQFTLYGTTTCTDLPWSGNACPIGVGSWRVLGQTTTSFASLGDWYEVTVSFTPTEDIYAVALGSDCNNPDSPSYYYVDELTLADSGSFVC